MPAAPDPITSPPPVPGQPYDATTPGRPDASQSTSEQVYDAAGWPRGSGADLWQKTQEGGAADFRTGKVTGGWPPNGTSSDGPWKNC